MALHFATLASGSSGNACLVEAEDCALLLDCGLGPRQLATRLALVGGAWPRIRAVLLTHTHGDHWNERTFGRLRKLGIPVYCHAGQREELSRISMEFAALCEARLVRPYDAGSDVEFSPRLRVRPVPVRHDGGPTFGFRIEGAAGLFGQPCALGYAADLGCWDAALVEAFADVELLALEFNHDVSLERLSGRSPYLIARVLGDEGHLSNAQAAALVKAILARSEPGRLRHLIQLHMSRDCNREELAHTAGRRMLGDAAAIHTAGQFEPGPLVKLGAEEVKKRRTRSIPRKSARTMALDQAWLPGMDDSGETLAG